MPASPEGYTTVACPEINATVAMPEDWSRHQFTRQEELMQFWFTREPISGDNPLYETGLEVAAYRTVAALFRAKSAEAAARQYITQLRKGMRPTSTLERSGRDPFVAFQTTLEHPGGQVAGRHMRPTSFHFSATANKRTNVLYMAMFETPTTQWERYKTVARTMLDSLQFDPAFA